MPDSKTDSANETGQDDLTDLRCRIDQIDKELLRLLNDRARCAEQVAEVKSARKTESGEGAEEALPVFYRPEREAQILERVKAENTGPLADEDIARLFREIISCCLALEQSLKVAYLGPAGTYTQVAAFKHFGQFAQTHSLASIDEVFREVSSGDAHYGVVPVENSTEGMINHTLDCLVESSLHICSEVELPIHQALMTLPDTDSDKISTIYSHPQSLAQCRDWLARFWPGADLQSVSSNAEAARLVSEQEGSAAIAGEMAADQYGLRVLARNIEDHADNKTRFLVLGREKVGPSGRDKTSLLVSAHNEPGALYRILEPFHSNQIDLTRLESRPARSGDWCYVFFMDFDGHESDPLITKLLSEIEAVADALRVLGSYPQASI